MKRVWVLEPMVLVLCGFVVHCRVFSYQAPIPCCKVEYREVFGDSLPSVRFPQVSSMPRVRHLHYVKGSHREMALF